MNSPLIGGTMRRRRSRLIRGIVPVAITAALAAIGTALYLDTRESSAPPPPVPATGAPSERAPSDSDPRAALAPPGISLVGGDALDVRFRKPPRGGLVFDV